MANNTWQVVFAGVGGQGLVLDGFLLGEAASIHENRQATMVMTYGSETRGTFTKTDVIVSDNEIGFPGIENPDVVVALAQVAYDRYVDNMRDGSIIIYDDTQVTIKDSKAAQFGYPIKNIAVSAGGAITTNLAAMGVLVKKTGLVSEDAIIKAIESRFESKPKIVEGNIASFKAGLNAVK